MYRIYPFPFFCHLQTSETKPKCCDGYLFINGKCTDPKKGTKEVELTAAYYIILSLPPEQDLTVQMSNQQHYHVKSASSGQYCIFNSSMPPMLQELHLLVSSLAFIEIKVNFHSDTAHNEMCV